MLLIVGEKNKVTYSAQIPSLIYLTSAQMKFSCDMHFCMA